MTRRIKASTIVQEGGRVQIESCDLTPGTRVEVVVLHDDGQAPRSIDDILAGYAGGRLFKSAREVDDYIRAERDSWDR
jgi:hypothetical protein